MDWLKKVFEPMKTYRSPHELMTVQFSDAIFSAVINIGALFLFVVFIRSFFTSGLSGDVDKISKILLMATIGIGSGIFAIPFGNKDLATGDEVSLFLRIRRYYFYILVSFYFVLIVSGISIYSFTAIGYPVVFEIRGHIPGLTDLTSLFLYLLSVSVLTVTCSFYITKYFVGPEVWNSRSVRKWYWFPLYVVVLAVSSTVAIY